MNIIKHKDIGKNDLIQLIPKNSTILELGVWKGDYSEILLSSKPKIIYLCDPWQAYPSTPGQPYSNLTQNDWDRIASSVMDRFYDNDNVDIYDYSDCYKEFENNYFDFIFIDANHEYKHVKEDLENWWPKMKSGGLFSGDDFLDGKHFGHYFGVKQAVNEFCENNGITLNLGCKGRAPIWWIEK